MPFFYGEKMVTSEKLLNLLQAAESSDIFDKAVVGYLLPDGTSNIVTLNTPEDTVFDIASLTKVCPTSTLALTYVLEGQLSIDAKVIDYIPELQTNYRDEIYVSHLLTHSLDYRVPMKTLTALSPEEILNVLYTYEFSAAPGTVFNYGNPASVLLGILLQRLTGKTLQEQGNERFFTPLGMTRSGYDPLTRVPKSEIAATELCEFRHREIQGGPAKAFPRRQRRHVQLRARLAQVREDDPHGRKVRGQANYTRRNSRHRKPQRFSRQLRRLCRSRLGTERTPIHGHQGFAAGIRQDRIHGRKHRCRPGQGRCHNNAQQFHLPAQRTKRRPHPCIPRHACRCIL